MSRKHSLRTLEHGNIRAEVVGPSTRCALWIEGKPYMKGIRTLRAAHVVFERYVSQSYQNGLQRAVLGKVTLGTSSTL